MSTTLFNHAALYHIDEGLEVNRQEAGSLVLSVRAGCAASGKRINLLNQIYFELSHTRHQLTGEDPAPFRMGRS